jgi:phosphohistidine phosphatase
MRAKRLLILRHAKSSWADPDLPDRDRPLNARGRKDAARIGRFLADSGRLPDLVLCSSAARTVETLDLLRLPPAVEVIVEEQLYGAGSDSLLDRFRLLPDPVASAMLVAHNPGVEDFARDLDGERLRLADKYPTGGLAVLRVPVRDWQALAPGIGVCEAFVIPRDLD